MVSRDYIMKSQLNPQAWFSCLCLHHARIIGMCQDAMIILTKLYLCLSLDCGYSGFKVHFTT